MVRCWKIFAIAASLGLAAAAPLAPIDSLEELVEDEQPSACEGARTQHMGSASRQLLQVSKAHGGASASETGCLEGVGAGGAPASHGAIAADHVSECGTRNKHAQSGALAKLDQEGYARVALSCCHHEMEHFVRREIARQGLDVCDEGGLHGFIHWFDCVNDTRTYTEMTSEIGRVKSSVCPWLGHLPNCPKKGENCGAFSRCSNVQVAGAQSGDTATLDEKGYKAVALMCCKDDMEAFVRREITRQGYDICDDAGLLGTLHWFDCDTDKRTYKELKQEITRAASGHCPWLGKFPNCPPQGWNCVDWDTIQNGAAVHRRRTHCMKPACASPSNLVRLDFFNAVITENNLGGLGPNQGDPTVLRYNKIGTFNSKDLDLVISADFRYRQGDPLKNGKNGNFGQISLQSGDEAEFMFQFEYADNHGVAIELPEFYFTFFDIDDGGGSPEALIVEGFESYLVPWPNDLRLENKGATVEFHARMYGELWDNPSDPMNLGIVTKPGKTTTGQGVDQRARSVQFFFTATSNFKIVFGIACTRNRGCPFARQLLFAGESSLSSLCPNTR